MDRIQHPTFVGLLKSAVTEPGYLQAAYTRFHNYSLGNQLLAWIQCLEALAEKMREDVRNDFHVVDSDTDDELGLDDEEPR